MNTDHTPETLERRPMGAEERARWQQRLRSSRSRLSTCKTCGGSATVVLGDVVTGDQYCRDHGAIARLRRDRAAMRDGR
jgi:hypothetical protein